MKTRLAHIELGIQAQLFAVVSEIASAASAFASQLASVRILPENRQMVLVLRFGDIITLSLEHDSPTPQVEGTIEPGILAAAWSPDDSALALVTGLYSYLNATF